MAMQFTETSERKETYPCLKRALNKFSTHEAVRGDFVVLFNGPGTGAVIVNTRKHLIDGTWTDDPHRVGDYVGNSSNATWNEEDFERISGTLEFS